MFSGIAKAAFNIKSAFLYKMAIQVLTFLDQGVEFIHR